MLYSALGFGLIPIFALLAYRGGINVITLLAIRFVLSGLVLLAFLLARGRRALAQVGAVFPGLIGLGVCYTLQSGFYFSAVRYISASLASILLYSYPAFVCLLAFLVEREKLAARTLLALAVSLAGVVLVLGSSLGAASPVGVLLALGAAAVYSLYITLANRVLRRVEPVVALSVVTLVTSVLYIGLGLAAGRLSFAFAPSTWLPIVLIIVVSTLLAIPAFFLRHRNPWLQHGLHREHDGAPVHDRLFNPPFRGPAGLAADRRGRAGARRHGPGHGLPLPRPHPLLT